MRRASLLLALALGISLVPAATAAGPTITYTAAGTAGANGWYRSDVTASLSVSGATDSNCPLVRTFHASSESLSCTATDGSSTVTFNLQFKIDKDAPGVSGASPDRAADSNGWYNHPVTVGFAGSDAGSGIGSCSSVTFSGPDSGSASVSGTCTDVAGNVSAPSSFALKYDATPPSASASAARAPDANGWYNHAVAVSFSGSDSGSGIGSCSSGASYSGPDTSGATVSGSCTDAAGNSGSASTTVRYDATPPAVTAAPDREPNAAGWYNAPVTFRFSGTDALSGIADCDQPRAYSGPDTSTASSAGACRDNAGNAATATATLRYDSTPPKLTDLVVQFSVDAATLRWKQPADTADVAVTRSPGRAGPGATTVYHGRAPTFRDPRLRAGVAYRYTLTSRDQAGNKATASLTAKLRTLYAPTPNARVKAGTVLAWLPKAGATYYNVQIFRNGHKVLTTWTQRPRLTLPKQWRLAGKTIRLQKGRYRWYVWPGLGRSADRRYGKLLGSSSFRV